jgi:hypothetical protein
MQPNLLKNLNNLFKQLFLNMKTGLDALVTAENEYGHAKHEWEPTPSEPSKMSSGTQNKKTGPDNSGTVENESSVSSKMGHDALGIVENESEHAKHENGARRPRYRRKRVGARNI